MDSLYLSHSFWQVIRGAGGNLAEGVKLSVMDKLRAAIETQRLLSDAMTEAMDTEFGRLLVETVLASRLEDGTLAIAPEASNTVIILIGDNGSFGRVAKLPFDLPRAKGTVYQTGVWVPLVLAGPMVEVPGHNM